MSINIISAIDMKPGMTIEFNNEPCLVCETQHVKPGKGGAYIQAVLKTLNGRKLNNRFNSGAAVNQVRIEELHCQYLYSDDIESYFIDNTTNDQIVVNKDTIKEIMPFIEGGTLVTIGMYNNAPLFVRPPAQMTFEVVETETTVKHHTATSVYKSATLSNGMKIMVPPYTEQGANIIINTEDNTYVGKKK